MIMKKSRLWTNVLTVVGAVMLPAGVALQFLLPESSYRGMALAGVLCGLGGTLLVFRVFGYMRQRRNPGAAAEAEAAQKDERGQLITGKAALVALFATLAALSALTLYFLFAQMRLPCFLAMGVLLVQAIAMVAARWHYGKKM
ncbi:MAG: hypothetical protein LBB75_09785 [Oscillospiraceae bacterium]|jgi:hypothetical protein|nr:hypothetical protein [Oscillospiraceae bacterium]